MSGNLPLHTLLGSRICHDLISPIGAIGNGVELLAMSANPPSPELALIAESVENATVRIQFFRIAFGAATPDAFIDGKAVGAVLADLFRGTRTRIDWQPLGDLPRSHVKLACLLVLCAESALPRGGTIAVCSAQGAWHLTATSEYLQIDPDLWEAIIDPTTAQKVKAANVHFPLVAEAVNEGQFVLQTELTNTKISVRF